MLRLLIGTNAEDAKGREGGEANLVAVLMLSMGILANIESSVNRPRGVRYTCCSGISDL